MRVLSINTCVQSVIVVNILLGLSVTVATRTRKYRTRSTRLVDDNDLVDTTDHDNYRHRSALYNTKVDIESDEDDYEDEVINLSTNAEVGRDM